MSSLKPINHGFDHRPGGTDPIPDEDVILWAKPPFWFDLTSEASYASIGGTVVVDSTRINNYRLLHSSGTTTEFIVQLFPFGPGNYELVGNMQAGPGYGTMDVKVAGAYDFDPVPTTPGTASTDWLDVASFDFSKDSGGTPYVSPLTYSPFSRKLTNYAYITGGYDGGTSTASWTIDNGATDYGFSKLFKLSGTIDSLSHLDGGAGYYWVRIDVAGTIEFSDLWISAE